MSDKTTQTEVDNNSVCASFCNESDLTILEDIIITDDFRYKKVKINILHVGFNKKRDYFYPQEVIERAIPTLQNMPIVAFIDATQDDFRGHERVGDKLYTNVYGVIPADNNAHFEDILCSDGVIRTYLVAEGIVWTRNEDVIDIFNRDIIKGHSSEFIIKEYELDENENKIAKEISFIGFCALGDNVSPACYDSSMALLSSEEVAQIGKKKICDINMHLEVLSNINSDKGGECMKKESKKDTSAIQNAENANVNSEEATKSESANNTEHANTETESVTNAQVLNAILALTENITKNFSTQNNDDGKRDESNSDTNAEDSNKSVSKVGKEIEYEMEIQQLRNEVANLREESKKKDTEIEKVTQEFLTYKGLIEMKEKESLIRSFKNPLYDNADFKALVNSGKFNEYSVDELRMYLESLVGKETLSCNSISSKRVIYAAEGSLKPTNELQDFMNKLQ